MTVRTEQDTTVESDQGPRAWLSPFIEQRASRLIAKGAKIKAVQQIESYVSSLQPQRSGSQALAPMPHDYWLQALQTYQQRRSAERKQAAVTMDKQPVAPGEPGITGRSNWVPLGPSIARKGQAGGHPGVGGRVARIAVAPGGTRIYVASALGGVWRSDDAGATWSTNSDSLDVDPLSLGATSLCCGAIAINQSMPDRVYVGTGEGDTSDLFSSRFLGALPSYRGIGPVRSDDGGMSWHVEAVAVGSAPLAGQSFYQLAVDPADGDNVVAATTAGLYRREPDGMGGYHWSQKRTGRHHDVVVSRSGGVTSFFAAVEGGPVYRSNDGNTWTTVGSGFPAGATRISLAVRPTDAGVLYALVANSSFDLLGIYSLDGGAGAWKQVSGAPSFLNGQAEYTCCIAVDPNDTTTIYLGAGSTFFAGDYSGTVYRGTVTPAGAAYAMTATYIGGGVHGDIHHLIHAPGDSNALWLGCDGGIFATTNPKTTADFKQRNVGFATLAMNYFSQHPSEPAVIFCGAQDNGTIRYTGEEAWRLVVEADGGYCVINWHDPYQTIIFQNGSLKRTQDGGSTFTNVTPGGYFWSQGLMAPPIAGAPPSGTASDADIVVLGADRPYLTTDFGNSWVSMPSNSSSDVLPTKIFSLAFASATKMYAATAGGQIYRYDKSGATWSRTQIDNAVGGVLPLANIVTKMTVDPTDASGNSLYICFGGSGDFRHVWHFNGTAWSARSGPGAGLMGSLLDVEHNAIVADPATPGTLFVGADIGVWRSTDGGMHWSVFSDGLPDAAVLDLQIHGVGRLLRASTHGRGLFEYKLDLPVALDTELYIRDTNLDLGHATTVDWLSDPENFGTQVRHWESPNIKVDVPTPAGYQTPTPSIDFFQFVDQISDGSGGVATMDAAAGTVVNRVYVEVHNRGIVAAASTKVMLLLTDASPGLPALPAGFAANVVAGTPVGAPYTLVGVKTVTNLRVGIPQVVEFALPSTMLPPPASLPGDSHYCLLALMHSVQDPFSATQTNPDLLTVAERKVGQKNLNIVSFVGVPPEPAPWHWNAFQLHGDFERERLSDLLLDLRAYGGEIGLVLPHTLKLQGGLDKALSGFEVRHDARTRDEMEDWQERQHFKLRGLQEGGRYDHARVKAMQMALKHVANQPLLMAKAGSRAQLRGMLLQHGAPQTAFLAIRPPANAQIGDRFDFALAQRYQGKRIGGGCTYSVRILAPFKQSHERRHVARIIEEIVSAAV
ncbi:MAG: hypothetical protein M3N23_03815 [Pseudomonadota bacterium]|nr:hypothetical protein [Pseudomonadota bacterium]